MPTMESFRAVSPDVLWCGDAVRLAIAGKFRAMFGRADSGRFGMTEVIPFTANMPDQLAHDPLGGRVRGMTIRLVDDAGQRCSARFGWRKFCAHRGRNDWLLEGTEISAATMEGGFIHRGDLERI